MAKDDASRRHAERPRGLGELHLAQRQELAADDTGDGLPAQEAEDHRDVEGVVGAEDSRGQRDDQEGGHGQQDVGHAHHQRVCESAEIAGERAHQDAQRSREQHGPESDDQRQPAAVENLAEDVVAIEGVGSEQVRYRRRRARLEDVEVIRGLDEVGEQEVPQRCAIARDDDEQQPNHSPLGQGMRHEAPEDDLAQRELLDRDVVAGLEDRLLADLDLLLYRALKHRKSSGRRSRMRSPPAR